VRKRCLGPLQQGLVNLEPCKRALHTSSSSSSSSAGLFALLHVSYSISSRCECTLRTYTPPNPCTIHSAQPVNSRNSSLHAPPTLFTGTSLDHHTLDPPDHLESPAFIVIMASQTVNVSVPYSSRLGRSLFRALCLFRSCADVNPCTDFSSLALSATLRLLSPVFLKPRIDRSFVIPP
jgi:hypothetical protein